ncbi:MAG: pentapeptide repeat-containing protein, partial [Pseudomonadota bacterium]
FWADLSRARMEGADLSEARMEGANLWGADLRSTDLRDWSIARTSLRSVDFTGAQNLSKAAVNSAFGDRATILPDGPERPAHWDVPPLDPDDPGFFDLKEDAAYQAWLATLPER